VRIFLLWRRIASSGPSADTQRVSSDLQRLFSPLFRTRLRARTIQNCSASFVVLELPVVGWKPAFYQEDVETWALAPEYPINARSALTMKGTSVDDEGVLPTLGRELQAAPAALLQELAPPFSLVWSSKRTGQTFVQTDGLGQSQLFEFQDGRLWALSNKILAFTALGVALEPEREQWAVRATLGWFPLEMTGYKGIRFLEPGTQLHLDSDGLTRTRHDVLSKWVRSSALSSSDCLELARSSLLRHVSAAMPLCDENSVGLSGGWDSRAVVSTLRAAGAEFAARVRGLPGRPDVIIARELARIGGFDLKVHSSSGVPPAGVEMCKRSISLALCWQAGYMVTHKHKTFLADQRLLDGGSVNIMGQHGEIGRGYYAKRIGGGEVSEAQYEECLVGRLMAKMPPVTRKVHHEIVRDVIRQAYRQADRYDLQGSAQLDFFYLYERTRRWASGSLGSQTGVVLTPFLNPGYIRAVFSYTGDLTINPFHRHIIATHSPDWTGVQYAKELNARHPASETAIASFRDPDILTPDWRPPSGKENYDSLGYWEAVGRPIIEEALGQGGFWTEIFDRDAAEKQWPVAPDELAMLYLLPDALQGRAPGTSS